jgi:hypothetical protein
MATQIELSPVSKNGPSPSTTPVSTNSDDTTRTHRAASVALATVNLVPSPSIGQPQDKKEERQFTQIPMVLVEGAGEPEKDDVEEAFFECEIPAEDDIEEAFFDPNNLMQESKHAKDMVRTLSKWFKKDWDEKHGEGSWDSRLRQTLERAEEEYSDEEDISNSEYKKDLAWIAVSKVLAEKVGLPPELYCPQFPWENTTEEGVANTENFERWQAAKPYLESGAQPMEERSQTQPQTNLSFLREGLTTLATTVASIWALSSLPGAAAAAVPVLNSAANGVCGFCLPSLSVCYTGAATAVNGTIGAIASGTVSAIGSAASTAYGLVPYVSGTVATVSSATTAVVPYVAPVVAAAPPVIAAILGTGAPNVSNFTSNSSLPMCPVGAAPDLSSVAGTATSGSLLGYLGYLPPLVSAGYALLEGNYPRAAANLAGGAIVTLASTYYGVPGAIAAGVLTAAAGRYLATAPVDAASALPAHPGFYERKNVVCKKGVFNIKVPGPEGLSPEQQEDLINAFIAEVLDQNPVKTRVGDIVEFEFPESKRWTAHVTPKDGQAAGRTLDGEKTYSDSPSHRNSIKKLETLREVMVKGAKAHAVMTALRSITMDSIPSNAPAVAPVVFSNAPPSLCSAMQAMLAIPKVLKAMEVSQHPEINRVAHTYKAKLGPSGEGPLDLKDLERTLNPDSRTLDVRGYQLALLDLMAANRPNQNDMTMGGVQVPQLEYDNAFNVSDIEAHWGPKREEPTFPKLKISPRAGIENLQDLVDANQSRAGVDENQSPKTFVKEFDSIPNFLQVSVAEATGANPAAKLDEKLEFDLRLEYIERNKRNTAPPKYALQNIVLHTAAGQVQVTYQRTVEKVNGETLVFYWKCDPAIENGAPVCIEKSEFRQAANSTDAKDLFFLKVEKSGAVQEKEILAQWYDTDSNPGNLKAAGNVSAKYDKVAYDMRLPLNTKIVEAVRNKSSGDLNDEVKKALEAAVRIGDTEFTLPVPEGGTAEGMNWPIGVMWYAAQEFIKTHPQFKVHLAIDKSKKRGERRTHLVTMIDKADEIYQQSPNFAEFTKAWGDYCEPKPARRGFFY